MPLHLLIILIIALSISVVSALIHILIRQLRNKVDIVVYSSDGSRPLYISSTITHTRGMVAEAHVPGGLPNVAIGRVQMDKDGNNAIVEILDTPVNDDVADPLYNKCGFLDQDGYIYKYLQPNKLGPAVRIGYAAQPSRPDVPCHKGERTWRTLWLHAYLDVYLFKDGVDVEAVIKDTQDLPAPVVPVTDTPPVEPDDKPVGRRDQSGLTQTEIFDDIEKHMVRIQGGTFNMGTPARNDSTDSSDGKERGMAEQNESPVHVVTLTDYYIAKYPVTQAEWQAVMGINPSDCAEDLNYPVAPVSYNQCIEFISKLNSLTGGRYCLPTEAQWEFAARGGNKSNNTVFSGSETFAEVGWADQRHQVGIKKPNELGIFDMSGLVREWCSDIWGHYSDQPQFNPAGPCADDPLVIKNNGGELYYVVRSPSGNETVTNRKGETPDLSKEFKSYGLRLAIQIPLPAPEPESVPEQETETVQQPLTEPVVLNADASANAPTQYTLSSFATRIARCDLQGRHKSNCGAITSESRAAAYAAMSKLYQKRECEEYYSDASYSWKDTALLASVIYTLTYICYYIGMAVILQRPVVGKFMPYPLRTATAIVVLYLFYFVFWVFIRSVKIEMIESGRSFQPQLSLFNKSVGSNNADIFLIIIATLGIPVSLLFFDCDFISLLLAILTGTVINRLVPDISKPWCVLKSYSEDRKDLVEDDDDYKRAPEGDLSCTFNWDLDDSSLSVHGTVILKFDPDLLSEERQNNPFYSQNAIHPKDQAVKMYKILLQRKDYMRRIKFLAYSIGKIAERSDLNEAQRLQFVLDFVQEPNIKFVLDRDSERIQFNQSYMRFPDETLFDKEGDHDCKAFLAAMLYHCLGYNVLFLYSPKHDQYAIGVEERFEWTDIAWRGLENKFHKKDSNDRNYVICEVATDMFKVGDLLPGLTPDDFDIVAEMFVENEDDRSNMELKSFDWDLDSENNDIHLHGSMVMEFSPEAIETLRKENPFNRFGTDGRSYADYLSEMTAFLRKRPDFMSNLKLLADNINNKTMTVSELDRYQFALDFIQEPNIRYCVDEKSLGIKMSREYVRYPDELFFDKEGDCDCKSFTAAMLFRTLGRKVIFLISKEYSHAAIALEYDEEWGKSISNFDPDNVLIEHNGVNYIFCETTGDGNRIGHIKAGDSIRGFDGIVEII